MESSSACQLGDDPDDQEKDPAPPDPSPGWILVIANEVKQSVYVKPASGYLCVYEQLSINFLLNSSREQNQLFSGTYPFIKVWGSMS
jgi:hypothetical protein